MRDGYPNTVAEASRVHLSATRAIHYVGMLRSAASWAKVGRELVQALINAGYKVGISEIVEDRSQLDFPLSLLLESALELHHPDCITLTFSDPSEYSSTLSSPSRVGMLVYEATRWPPHWVSQARKYVEHVVVPSTFCSETLKASCYPADRISIVPHGIDPLVYHPGNRHPPGSREELRLLFVGTPARRKGLDLLLSAFKIAFEPTDNVTLVIKTLVYSDTSTRKYVDDCWQKTVCQFRNEGYRIHILTDCLSETKMADLYRSADMICLPSRGEGFALPLLEAMACGTPVLTTDWSGQTDFCDDNIGILLQDFAMIPGESMLIDFDHPERDRAMMIEPSLDSLVCALRKAASDRFRLTLWGKNASQRAREWTWASAADKLAQALVQAHL